jgi:glyoxylase-like metal-dependent hydrolase (beta-lactamase superfamily II)
VQTLFNTHWHPEQTGLNEAIGKAGKTIIAHENTRLWLSTDITWSWNGQRFKRLPKIAQPNKTFYTTGQLSPDIRYGYIPDAAHTDGDMYVYFPKQNVLAVGDVVSNQGWPVVDWQTGGWIGGIAGALQRLQSLGQRPDADRARARPGHGPSGPQGAGHHVRDDLRASDDHAEQRARPERSGRRETDQGIRCANGQSR